MMTELQEGDVFSTWSEFQAAFSEFCDSNRPPWIRTDCTTTGVANQDDHSKQKYVELSYKCVYPDTAPISEKRRMPPRCLAKNLFSLSESSDQTKGIFVIQDIQRSPNNEGDTQEGKPLIRLIVHHVHDIPLSELSTCGGPTEHQPRFSADEETEATPSLSPNLDVKLTEKDTFCTWDDFEKMYLAFCQLHSHCLTLHSFKTVESANINIKEKNDHYPCTHKYMYATYKCTHWQKDGSSEGQSCPALIMVCSDRHQGVLVIRKMLLEHNHDHIQDYKKDRTEKIMTATCNKTIPEPSKTQNVSSHKQSEAGNTLYSDGTSEYIDGTCSSQEEEECEVVLGTVEADTACQHATLCEGDVFPDWKSFHFQFSEYCEAGKYIFNMADFKTVDVENKKIGHKQPRHPPSHKYTHVEYKCLHYPDCPANVLVTSDRKRGILVVRQVNAVHDTETHQNAALHDAGEDQEFEIEDEGETDQATRQGKVTSTCTTGKPIAQHKAVRMHGKMKGANRRPQQGGHSRSVAKKKHQVHKGALFNLDPKNLTMHVGDTFDDWESFQNSFTKLCKTYGQDLKVFFQQTVQRANNTIMHEKDFFPASHKYTSVRYRCTQHGRDGKTCPARVVVSSNRKRGVLVLEQLMLTHDNSAHGQVHEILEEGVSCKSHKVKATRASKRQDVKNSNHSERCSPCTGESTLEDSKLGSGNKALFQQGDKFRTWKEFETKLSRFSKEYNYRLAKYKFQRIGPKNIIERKNKRKTYPLRHKYYHVKYRCGYTAPLPKCDKAGAYESDCPVSLAITSNKNTGYLVIEELHLTHNHEVKTWDRTSGSIDFAEYDDGNADLADGENDDQADGDHESYCKTSVANEELRKGGTFKTWDAFEKKFSDYCNKNRCTMTKTGSQSVVSKNKILTKVGKANCYPQDHKYAYVKYVCSYHRVRNSTGKNNDDTKVKETCPGEIIVSSDREKGLLTIIKFDMEHNHEVNEEQGPQVAPQNMSQSNEELHTNSECHSDEQPEGQLEEGYIFETWDEFESQFLQFCETNHHPFIMGDSKTVDAVNKSRAPGMKPYPSEHKYMYVKYKCSKRCKSKGKNGSDESQNCPAQAYVTSNKARGVLVLKHLCLEHNHDISNITVPCAKVRAAAPIQEDRFEEIFDKDGQPMMQKGSTYKTWEEFEAKFSELCRKNNFQMVKADSQRVDSKNRRILMEGGHRKLYPEEHKNLYTKYICIHGRSRKMNSTNNPSDSLIEIEPLCPETVAESGDQPDHRKQDDDVKSLCPAKVAVSSNRMRGVLTVTYFDMSHNHELVIHPREDGRLQEGDTFETWAEFQAKFSYFCKENHHTLVLGDSRTVANKNKGLPASVKPYPTEHKYMYVKYICVKGRHSKQSKQVQDEIDASTVAPNEGQSPEETSVPSNDGISDTDKATETPAGELSPEQVASSYSETDAPSDSSAKETCPVYVYVTSDKERGVLVLKRMYLQHNHEYVPYRCTRLVEDDPVELGEDGKPVLQRGSTFKTWEEFKQAFWKYCCEHGYKMAKVDCQSVESRNKRMMNKKYGRNVKLYPKAHKFLYTRYVCAFGRRALIKSYKSPSRVEFRKKLNEAKPLCDAKVIVSSNRERGVLVVTHFNMEHGHARTYVDKTEPRQEVPDVTDWHAPAPNTLEAGHTFKTWEEFEDHFFEFCHTSQQPMVKDDCKLAAGSNRRLKPGVKPYPLAHKYSWVKFRCVHGIRAPGPRSTKTSLSGNEEELHAAVPDDSCREDKCPAKILVSSDRDLGLLVVRRANLKHNHELGLKRCRKRRNDCKNINKKQKVKSSPEDADLEEASVFDQYGGNNDDDDDYDDGGGLTENLQQSENTVPSPPNDLETDSPRKGKSDVNGTESEASLMTVTVQGNVGCESTKLMEDGNHHSIMAEQLYGLQQQNLLCDVLLYIGEACVPAHSAVVSMYLKSITETLATITERPIKLCLQDNISMENFKEVLKYMYTGKMLLTPENVAEINLYCVRWGMTNAAQLCSAFHQISVEEGDINENTTSEELDTSIGQSWEGIDINLGANLDYLMKTPTKVTMSPKRKLEKDEDGPEAKKRHVWDMSQQWLADQSSAGVESMEPSHTLAVQAVGLSSDTGVQDNNKRVLQRKAGGSAEQTEDAAERLEKAMQAVRDSKVTLKQAAVLFDVPTNRLKSKLTGTLQTPLKLSSRVFTSFQEKVIVDYLQRLAKEGYGYYRNQLLKLCIDLARSIGAIPRTCVLKWAWLVGFTKRWSSELEGKLQPSFRTSSSPNLVTEEMRQAAFDELGTALKSGLGLS